MTQTMICKFILATAVATMAAGAAIADVPDHHHRKLAKDVDAFHAVLAPLWHARPGPERLPNACAKVEEMGRLASAIRSTDASQLVASVAAMKTACRDKPADIDGAFYDVHESFHHLLDAKPGSAKR
jgi:hypothetical protein